jgi:hypothetical protein
MGLKTYFYCLTALGAFTILLPLTKTPPLLLAQRFSIYRFVANHQGNTAFNSSLTVVPISVAVMLSNGYLCDISVTPIF